jgi:hypothetical protein
LFLTIPQKIKKALNSVPNHKIEEKNGISMANLALPLAAYTGNSLGRKKTARQTGRGRKTCQE